MVPTHLYGRTQHKTLQARLSEDILDRRERSDFFRTQPGKFFLREFILDETIPVEHRVPILARRRKRELKARNALAIPATIYDSATSASAADRRDAVLAALSSRNYSYIENPSDIEHSKLAIWSFVAVMRDTCLLTYRHGRYREDRDSFFLRRSAGFYSPVVDTDSSLFDQQSCGIVTSGLQALCIDLDMPPEVVWDRLHSDVLIDTFIVPDVTEGVATPVSHIDQPLLAVMIFKCPDWFEPLTRRLAINDLRWEDISRPLNNTADFDPWSQAVLARAHEYAKHAG